MAENIIFLNSYNSESYKLNCWLHWLMKNGILEVGNY